MSERQFEKAINLLRKAEGLHELGFFDKNKRVRAWKYILELQDGSRKIIERELSIKYERNETFIDLDTGKKVKVVRRDPIFRDSKK